MSHEGELIPAGHVGTTLDPLAVRAPGNAAPQAPAHMNGQQLVQWLTVQAGDMTGTLHHGVRALIPAPAILKFYLQAKLTNLLACVNSCISKGCSTAL